MHIGSSPIYEILHILRTKSLLLHLGKYGLKFELKLVSSSQRTILLVNEGLYAYYAHNIQIRAPASLTCLLRCLCRLQRIFAIRTLFFFVIRGGRGHYFPRVIAPNCRPCS